MKSMTGIKGVVAAGTLILCCSFGLGRDGGVDAGENLLVLKQDAVEITQRYAQTLKPALVKAIESGGPVEAISVCSVKAPEIAASLSEETGWDVKRVSLRPRNKDAAMPDAWERKVLEAFDARRVTGEAAEDMAHAEFVDGEFRFMKAQGVQSLCLTCHGDALSPDVEQALKAAYPDDDATGYALDDIRGAFSLRKR